MKALVQVRELIGWGLDPSAYRPASDLIDKVQVRAQQWIATQPPLQHPDPVSATASDVCEALFAEQRKRADLLAEMQGLYWTLGIVDLRSLIAFQRRIVNPASSLLPPSPLDWPALFHHSFGPPARLEYTVQSSDSSELVLHTGNPNLHWRSASTCPGSPLILHGGSPFFEVAEYRGRWFLRDGYHRAFGLMHAGIPQVPAVIVHARTLAELGPTQPWFFPESVLFSARPPLLRDFLEDQVTLEYPRPRLLKKLRVTMEESFEPTNPNPPTGDEL